MRRPIWGLAAALGIFLLAPSCVRAQALNQGQGLGNDPFSLYYGFYLPNQAYQAAQPRPEDTINANAAARQYNALRDRGELFEPSSPFGGADEGLDFAPYGSRRGAHGAHPSGVHSGNVRGYGPQGYFHRTERYHPLARTGRGPNRNIAVMRSGRGSGMPSMPSSPGPR